MKKDYKVVLDATCDLSIEMIKELDVHVIPMPVTLGDSEFMHYGDYRELSFEEFYRRLKNGENASTAQINMHTYIENFEPFLKQGLDILYICFSSGMSGTIQSANLAIEELAEKYPDNRIICVDSLSACTGLGLLAYNAVMKKREGYDIDELAKWVEENRLKLIHWFTVEDLNHLHRGGRLSKTAAIAGTMLNIKPILEVNNEGGLSVVEKIRGSKKVISRLVAHIKEEGVDLENQMIFIGQANNMEGAEKLKEAILKEVKVKDIKIMPIGPVLGAHVGSGMLSVFFLGDHRYS